MKSIILAMIDAQRLGTGDSCELAISHTIARMQNSFQPFFDEQYACGDNMGSGLDYLSRIGKQQTSSEDECTNYQTNPFVVAIVPDPIDYFRACGMTSVCRSRCRPEIEAFEEANNNPSQISTSYTVSLEKYTSVQTRQHFNWVLLLWLCIL